MNSRKLHRRSSLLHYWYMTTDDEVESLIQQATELPEDAQAALVQSFVTMRFQCLGIDDFHDEQS